MRSPSSGSTQAPTPPASAGPFWSNRRTRPSDEIDEGVWITPAFEVRRSSSPEPSTGIR
ncbi:MAG: hypothetical protein IPF66_24325 [Holophagales bacterium]|nr:hypothetical protein [Holophagales bacterium]